MGVYIGVIVGNQRIFCTGRMEKNMEITLSSLRGDSYVNISGRGSSRDPVATGVARRLSGGYEGLYGTCFTCFDKLTCR